MTNYSHNLIDEPMQDIYTKYKVEILLILMG